MFAINASSATLPKQLPAYQGICSSGNVSLCNRGRLFWERSIAQPSSVKCSGICESFAFRPGEDWESVDVQSLIRRGGRSQEILAGRWEQCLCNTNGQWLSRADGFLLRFLVLFSVDFCEHFGSCRKQQVCQSFTQSCG